MNQTIIFALFVMAMLIVVCVGYSASQAWRSLLVEQRLNQIKGSGDSRLVRWEDLLTLIARPLRRSRDLAAVERSMQQAGFIKPWQTDLFLLFRALVLIAAAVGGWLAIDIDPTHLVQKPLPPLAYLFLLFVAGRAPGWFLSELAERRQNRIRLFIPKAVDLLTICMSCGMSLEEAFDRVIDVNLKGAFNCVRHVAPIMMKQRYGRIVSVSSVVGLFGNAGQVNYSASKAGIIGLTKSVAKELAARGITANAVAPGFIGTEMTKAMGEKAIEAVRGRIAMKEFGEPQDVANAVRFLASDEARYITGQVLAIDGGMSL